MARLKGVKTSQRNRSPDSFEEDKVVLIRREDNKWNMCAEEEYKASSLDDYIPQPPKLKKEELSGHIRQHMLMFLSLSLC